jgi:hypothetical protein
MAKTLLCCALTAIICTGCVSIHSENKSTASKTQNPKACPKESPKLLRHVLLFKFKEGTTPEQIREVETSFAALPGKIDSIKSFEWGTNVSKELTDGFTHCFVVTFVDEAGLEAYLKNPDLIAFRKSLKAPLEKAIAVDYWTIRQ